MNISTFYVKMIEKTAKMYHELEYLDYANELLGDCQEDEEGKIGNILETMSYALETIRETANLLEMDIEDM